MKRIWILIIIILSSSLTSCLKDDDININFSFDLVPIEQVSIPDQFVRGDIFEISVSYFRPTDCHSQRGFDFDRISNERTVSVVNTVINRTVCEDLGETDLVDASFNFFVGSEDSYVFRFWQGRNDQGENEFLIIEVPVVE